MGGAKEACWTQLASMPVSRPAVSAAVSTKRPLGVRPRMPPIALESLSSDVVHFGVPFIEFPPG